ncbi:MAG: NADH-quinone oxidoreductase subunit N [Pseudohongiellaceae bacterium]
MITIDNFTQLVPLLPLLIVTGTAVLVMVMIGLWRNYRLTAVLSILGLICTALVAIYQLPGVQPEDGLAQQVLYYADNQITPLIFIDTFTQLFTALIALTACCVAIFSYSYLRELNDSREEYFLLLLIATIGAVVMVGSNHFVSMVLGLETLSISLYGMLAYPLHGNAKTAEQLSAAALESAAKYLVLSAVASGFILFGMALSYALQGTLQFDDMETTVISCAETSFYVDAASAATSGITLMALLLISAGIAFKLSLVPFHIWTPDVYEGAPIPATAYLATVGKVAMFVVLMRYVRNTYALEFDSVLLVYSLIAAASILAGNLLALLQKNLKRILAYSSIAHIGYLLIALIAQGRVPAPDGLGIEAVSFYLLAYTITTLGAFGVISVLSSSERELVTVTDYRGLFWRRPWLAAIFTAMLLSLAGIPLTIGFIGKFYLFFAGVEASLWWLLLALVVGSGIGLYYYLRIVYQMLLPAEDATTLPTRDNDSTAPYVVLILLVILLLGLGVYPAPIMTLFSALILNHPFGAADMAG